MPAKQFSIANNQVLFDGEKGQLLSGAIHYFRTRPEQWEDRLSKLKNCGFNAVETYLAWNLHEKTEGQFDFSDGLDFPAFIRLAQKLGLNVLVRPGPYICSECDLGGMPGWLLAKPGIRFRCNNPVFLHYVKTYFHEILPRLVPLQCSHGGPVIAVQLENEYGSYASDKKYLRVLMEYIRQYGIDIQLYTSDGTSPECLAGGTLPELPATVNFRCRPLQAFEHLDAFDTGFANAHVAMELWVGKAWHWGIQPQHHSDESVAEDIRDIMNDHASVNCYMFHGGTNFAFFSGANYMDGYMPLLTSYEVDAILDEAGNPTPKYYAVQKVMEEFRPGSTAPALPSPSQAYDSIEIVDCVSLADSLDILSTPVQMPLPQPMEFQGQSFGFIQYSTSVQPYQSGTYIFENMRDRALVFLDGIMVAVVYRNDPEQTVLLDVKKENTKLEVLVENMGRINFGTKMESEFRGMSGFHKQGHVMHLSNWTVHSLPLDDWSQLHFRSEFPSAPTPAFYRAFLNIMEKPKDTFLKFPDGTRGYVQVNGFNVGRYWTIGPQRTLYIPAPLLKCGENQIVVFELHELNSCKLEFSPKRILDPMSEMIL